MDNLADKKAKLSSAKRALLEQRLRGISNSAQPERRIQRRPDTGPAPLSFAQQRLWFLDQLQPGNASYNVSRHIHIRGPFDRAALERALNELIERHESLRTVFRMQGSDPVQVVQAAPTVNLRAIDLTSLPEPEREAAAERLALEHAGIPFNLSEGPLLTTELVRVADDYHIVFLSVHHIVTDAWSTGLLVRELASLYEAFRKNEPSPLPELPIQYADFAVWQRQQLSGEILDRHVAYWKAQLAGAPGMLELPLDRPRPARQTFRGAFESFQIPAGLTASLKELAKEEGATLFMVLLAAFQSLLWRHTRQDEVVIGAPIANRTLKETESLIGFFVNTLVLRTRFDAQISFRELLRQVKNTTLAAYVHQDLPFERLVEEIQPERSLSHNPLFQVTLSLQNVPQMPDAPNFTVDPIGFDGGTTRLDLEAYVWDLPDRLTAELVYSSDIFDAATIKRLVQRFLTLLSGVTANPNSRIAELPLLAPEELQHLLPRHARQKLTTGETLPALFEKQVVIASGRVALSFAGEELTYDELNKRANCLANYLIKAGARPDQLIGVSLERSSELIVALLAVLKAGAAYVPLDPSYPAERLSLICADAALSTVITQDSHAALFGPSVKEVISLSAHAEQIAQQSDENPAIALDEENAAYVIYTSGSTGKPKGVVVTHRNVARLMKVTESLFKFGAQDVWTFFHSYAFDFSVWEMWGALLYGGRLVVVPFLVSRAPADFYALLQTEKVTVLNQTPSAFGQLIEAESNATDKNLPALREVVFGGEALELRALKPWVANHGDNAPRLVNMYGITETTVHVTYRPLAAAEIENESGSVIGRPLHDLDVYILDRQQQPAPIGVAGEMYVGGDGVARGYLNRADLTAERFVPNPFSVMAGARLYRTGDLARYVTRSNGEGLELEYLGRVDRQVKVRGFRIELGEIENVLNQHEWVRECVVIPAPNNRDQQLLAYVIPVNGNAISTESLRDHMKSRLPGYMVPASFTTLDKWPLTPNGKVDERALPQPDQNRAGDDSAFAAPRTETEAKLAQLWSEVLRLDKVGINDNFFDLGGHSLLATQVMTRIRETFKVNMPLSYFFERPTVAGLADFVQNPGEQDQPAMPEIRRLPRV